MSDCFYFESSYDRCLNKDYTPTIKGRMILTSCLHPEKCKDYKPGHEHGIKIEAK